MVGESIYMDKTVLKVCKRTAKPLVLYNGEAFRIIDLQTRKGIEKRYYRKIKRLYAKLSEYASLVIYNCEMLKSDYEAAYPSDVLSMVAYNSACCDLPAYRAGEEVQITYFGNLGVGRSDVLLQVADVVKEVLPQQRIDVYGSAIPENAEKLKNHPTIRYHGFVSSEPLKKIIAESDLLLHVESFDETISEKLKYAFSTKIAQCLCAGRCFVSYAPSGTASSQYLQKSGGAIMVTDRDELASVLYRLVNDPSLREEYARKAGSVGSANHNMQLTAAEVREKIERMLREKA
jgi:glycosyltransferase involved in cell wall biosynthesis